MSLSMSGTGIRHTPAGQSGRMQLFPQPFVNLSTGAVDLSVSGNRQDTSIRDIICSLPI